MKIRFYIILFFISLYPFLLHGNLVVRDEFSKIFDLAHGETAQSSVMLYNPTDVAMSVRVSQADYVYTTSGEDFFIEAGKYERSNATWVRFVESITLPAKENYVYHFSVAVPNQRALAGTYWSVLFFEETANLAPIRFEDITVNHRYCIQIISNIKDTGTIDMSFQDVKVQNHQVVLSLKNTGTLWFDATIKIDIFDENAQLINANISEGHRIYPALERQYHISMPILPPANYYAIIVVDCGSDRVFGHQISFSVQR